MYNIAIIGSGQLGSRHLQGLAKIDMEINIEVVDLIVQSLELARKRYEEIPANPNVKSISFFQSIEDLNNSLDLVIVATNADIRYELVVQLLRAKKVKNIILEKIVFQRVKEFDNIIKLFKQHKIKCWVNCPRRVFPFYRDLKSMISPGEAVSISVQGGDWGMACNSIHYLDLLAYLSQDTNLLVDATHLNSELISSKREGFYEVSGLLIGNIGDNRITLWGGKKEVPTIITLMTESLVVIIDEGRGIIQSARKDSNWEWTSEEKKIVYYQSELTHLVAKDILIGGDCELASLHESAELHKPFLTELIRFYNEQTGSDIDYCPIT